MRDRLVMAYRLLRQGLAHSFAVLALLAATQAYASENFVAGIYQDTTGNQYQVSGPTPSSTGRAQWTII